MTDVGARQPIPAGQLLDPDVVDEPVAFYHRLLDEAPVWRVPGRDLVVVSAFAAISEAVKRTDEFSSNIRSILFRDEAGLPALVPFGADIDGIDVLATADPPMHTLHRSMVFPELVARRMEELRPQVVELANALLTSALVDQTFDFMQAIANPIPITIVSRLIGFVDEDPTELLAAAFDSTALLSGVQSLDCVVAAMTRAAEVMGWIGAEVDDAVAGRREGILHLVARAVDDGELARADAVTMMHTLLSAGGESTTSLLGNAVHLLATRSDVQRRVRDDRNLLTPFVEEVLRLESPFRYHLRHLRRAAELRGVSLPAGSTVLLLWAAANRDPERYDDPDQLRLDRRTPRDHLGFGRGIHLCVGAPLARMEAQVVLDRLLDLTSSIELADEAPIREPSLMVRRFRRLVVRSTAV